MKTPSSTIMAATLAGTAATLLWGIVEMFTGVAASAAIVAGTTTLVAALFGYFKRETVLK